jgi:hypothetical protein
MSTHVPMTEARVGSDKILDVNIEETIEAEYDLGSTGEYVNISDIKGRLVIEPEFNRGAMVEVAERIENPSLTNKIKLLLQTWTIDNNKGLEDIKASNDVELDYGTLLFRGAEALDLPDKYDVSVEYSTDEIKDTSPDEMRNDMRVEGKYRTEYANIETEIEKYLDQNGVSVDQVDIGIPLHVRAKAESFADDDNGDSGVRYEITLNNKSRDTLYPSQVTLKMPPEIGRGTKIAESGDVDEGSYNPEKEAFEFNLDSISPNTEMVAALKVTQEAKGELSYVNGEVDFEKDNPFSDFKLQGFYDAGGIKGKSDEGDTKSVEINTVGSFLTSFTAETSEIMVGGQRTVNKGLSVEGITPQQAMDNIEEILRQENIGADRKELQKAEELADDSVKFKGGFSNGSVMKGETQIGIEVDVKGSRKVAQKQRGSDDMDSDETLPDIQRQTTTEYGRVGVTIKATGNNLDTVDQYVTRLRKDVQMDLESISEEI